MIKLNRMEIYGFKDASKNLFMDFSTESISVIFGENGCGKTTVLKIVHAVLAQDESILLAEKVQKIVLYYSIKNQQINEDRMISIYLNDNTNEKSIYQWKEFEESELINSLSILFGTQRGITTSVVQVYPDMIYNIFSQYLSEYITNRSSILRISKELAFHLNNNIRKLDYFNGRYTKRPTDLSTKHLLLDDLNISTIKKLLIQRYRLAKSITSERVQKALFDTLSLALNPNEVHNNDENNIPTNFPDLLKENREKLIEILCDTAKNTLRDQIIEILKGYDHEDMIKNIESNKLLSNLLYKMIEELESEQEILSSINNLVRIFNDQISSCKKLVITSEDAYIDLGNGTHKLNELSSGERHLLSFLTLFIIEGSNRNFLMIDEPEISLNIKWQRQLLPLLSELAPNSQIIVASHSPAITKSSTLYLTKMR